MEITLSGPLLLVCLSAMLFIAVTAFIWYHDGFESGDPSGIGWMFNLVLYSLFWLFPSLAAWAIWATWFREVLP